jgi:hypothetical protein
VRERAPRRDAIGRCRKLLTAASMAVLPHALLEGEAGFGIERNAYDA